MIVEVMPSCEGVSDRAFELVAARIRSQCATVLGLPTGSTPEGLYRRLVDATLDWSRVTTFNLDEYVGLAADHPQSYHCYMWDKLFSHINIDRECVHIPNAQEGGAAFEKRIRNAGGIDLQVLGIGTNGHIGFNEPGSALDSRTREVRLASRTLKDNARFFEHERQVPRAALTMGIGTILDARSILLLACGGSKALAVRRALEGPVTPDVPASALRQHKSVHVLLDRAAARRLATARQTP